MEQLIGHPEKLANRSNALVDLAYGVDMYWLIGQALKIVLASQWPCWVKVWTWYLPTGTLFYSIAHKMCKQNGALISELVPGTKPDDTFQFPKRNRIIAGLADARFW